MRRSLFALLALLAAAALVACGGKRSNSCSLPSEKADLAALTASRYLYPDLLPASLDLGAYPDLPTLLDALTATARAQGKDRNWSFVTTAAAQQQFFQDAQAVGFGVGLIVRGDRLFIGQVYPGSAAALAGVRRGDEIVALGSAEPLTPAAALLACDAAPSPSCTTLSDAIGPASPGLTRLLDVVPRGAATTTPVRLSLSKGIFGLDPVPAPVIVDRSAQGLPKAGYVLLRTFVSPANALLESAFATFQAAGVTDVVVDLRYNGGGLLSTAGVLANLLAANRAPSTSTSTMYGVRFNASHAGGNFDVAFAQGGQPLTPAHVAFLVSGASASASELVPNAVAPYVSTALVGHQTYGKPVGQVGFSSSCGPVVFLVSFRLLNASGFGDYYGGLPASGFAGCGIAADDDLGHDLGDPAEGQTAAALQWLADQSGPTPSACPTISGPLSVRAGLPPSQDGYPQPGQPTDAQRDLPGMF